VTLALHPGGEAQLVPSGAVADHVVGLLGDRLVAIACDDRPAPVTNHGDAPLAVWALGRPGAAETTVLAGPAAVLAYERACREWKLLMAAALVGIADRALELAVDFARERVAFGVPIATFQGISHPLADCSIGIVGARRLVWKAAWFADHEPDERPQLIPMAFLYASRVAVRSTTVGVHTQGGVGFTAESPMQLYFRRAKGWANVAGDPAVERSRIADALYGPAA
jgi:alkylation response protein AidB-like acyl-CoA dehydrogenase